MASDKPFFWGFRLSTNCFTESVSPGNESNANKANVETICYFLVPTIRWKTWIEF